MLLEGSCHCGAVRFSVRSQYPAPYQRCYCSICRKTQGGGGDAINLGADARTLKVRGEDHIRRYHVKLRVVGQFGRSSLEKVKSIKRIAITLVQTDPLPEILPVLWRDLKYGKEITRLAPASASLILLPVAYDLFVIVSV